MCFVIPVDVHMICPLKVQPLKTVYFAYISILPELELNVVKTFEVSGEATHYENLHFDDLGS